MGQPVGKAPMTLEGSFGAESLAAELARMLSRMSNNHLKLGPIRNGRRGRPPGESPPKGGVQEER
eukprot:12899487-Prorocentrum_lima.AAC.1